MTNVSIANISMPNNFKAFPCEEVWIVDTGATVRNIPHLNGIINQVNGRSKEKVTVGNGEKMESKAVGELKRTETDANVNPKLSVALKDVARTPQYEFNLLSLTKLMNE